MVLEKLVLKDPSHHLVGLRASLTRVFGTTMGGPDHLKKGNALKGQKQSANRSQWLVVLDLPGLKSWLFLSPQRSRSLPPNPFRGSPVGLARLTQQLRRWHFAISRFPSKLD